MNEHAHEQLRCNSCFERHTKACAQRVNGAVKFNEHSNKILSVGSDARIASVATVLVLVIVLTRSVCVCVSLRIRVIRKIKN